MDTIQLNNVYHQDCLIGMSGIPNKSVDLLLTDPPYNISQKSGFHTMGRSGIDFGFWDREFDQQTWLRTACAKIKKGGSAVVFNDYKNIGLMTDIFNECGLTVKELLIWKKTAPMPRNRERLYVTSVEVALWAVNGKGWTFHRQRDNYENGIFTYNTVHSGIRTHPNQKPKALIDELLLIHTNENDIVLDPFSGSGTIAASCKHLNRNYIAFENNKEYYDKSVTMLGG